MATLVLEFKQIESDGEKKIASFIHSQKLKQLLMRLTLIMYLSSAIISNMRKLLGKG